MIACIQIGTSTVQGELVSETTGPARYPPRYLLVEETRATVRVFGRDYTGIRIERMRR